MAWTYLCADENLTLSAPTKEQLVNVVIDHVNEQHKDMGMTRQEIIDSVNRDAKQAAA